MADSVFSNEDVADSKRAIVSRKRGRPSSPRMKPNSSATASTSTTLSAVVSASISMEVTSLDTKQSEFKISRTPVSSNHSSPVTTKFADRQPRKAGTPTGGAAIASTRIQAVASASTSLTMGSETKRSCNKIHDPRCRWKLTLEKVYERIEVVGSGTYGEVWKGRSRETGAIMAIKKVKMTSEKAGVPLTALREIKILQSLEHENIVKLHDVMTSKASDANRQKGTVHLIFEYVEHDMTGLVDSKAVKMDGKRVRCYMKQLLSAIFHMHSRGIMHRDIKPANILVTRGNVLKLADLGLARTHVNRTKKQGAWVKYENLVVTLWYRAPELLLGEQHYGFAVDMWSVGCVFAEWLYHRAILMGDDPDRQLKLIFNLCGTPTHENWPNHECLKEWPKYAGMVRQNPRVNAIDSRFRQFDADARFLVKGLLCLDPAQRLTAKSALDTQYFWRTATLESHQLKSITCDDSHEHQVRKRRKKNREHHSRGRSAHHQRRRKFGGGRAAENGTGAAAPTRITAPSMTTVAAGASKAPPPHARQVTARRQKRHDN